MIRLESFQEAVFFATVRITSSTSPNTASMGTGFFVRLDRPDNLSAIFLVTNRHVLADPTIRVVIDHHQRDSSGLRPLLGEVVSIDQSDLADVYVGHPNPDVDLACVNASIVADPATGIFFKSVHRDQFCSFNEPELLPGCPVWFVGYPENRFDATNNLPILRRGHIASIPVVDFNGRPEFVIDAQVFPGSSGSPVFAEIGDSYRFVGVVAQTMIRNAELQTLPADYGLHVPQVIGLGIVLKAPLVADLIDHAFETLLKTAEIHDLQAQDEVPNGPETQPDAVKSEGNKD